MYTFKLILSDGSVAIMESKSNDFISILNDCKDCDLQVVHVIESYNSGNTAWDKFLAQ
jgi:hypothetical protein